MGNLNAYEVPSGYLAPYGMDMTDKEDLNGIITDSNVVNNLDIVRLLYADIYTSRFYSGALTMPTIDAVNSAVANAADNSLILFYSQFSVFREDALQQNLIQYTNGQLYDVQGRQQSPYILQNTFAAYPKQGHFTNGTE